MTVKIGKVVNTHGINGDIRILSNSDFKDIRFKVGSEIIIDNKKYIINNYYTHKTFDIVRLSGLDNINDVLKLKHKDIYAREITNEELDEDEFLYKDLVGLELYSDFKKYGKVIEVINNPAHEILRVKNDSSTFLIPFNDVFIDRVDLENGIIYFNYMEGLIDED